MLICKYCWVTGIQLFQMHTACYSHNDKQLFNTDRCQPCYAHRAVRESRNRSGVAQRVPRVLGAQISMTFGTWRWWGCQPHAPAAFTTRKFSWYSFSLGAESTHGTVERNMSLKNPMTPPGIDPGTVRLVAQRLNHYPPQAQHRAVLSAFLATGQYSYLQQGQLFWFSSYVLLQPELVVVRNGGGRW